MSKITIVGAGNVGASAAHIIAEANIVDEIVLLDVAEGLAQGKALDMMHMRSVLGFETKISGTSNYEAARDSDIVVITAGIARKPGMTREDLCQVNAGIMASVIEQAEAVAPQAFYICVTNPLDIMTYLAYQKSGIPSHKLVGMGGVLDSARFSFAICEKLGCLPEEVEAWALGAHGQKMVCWPRLSTVSGKSLTDILEADEIALLEDRCINGGAEVVSYLKTGSAYYAPGASIARMVKAVMNDTQEVMSVCAFCDGEYGIRDLYVNVPVRLGKSGVEEIVEFELTAAEQEALHESAQSIRASLEALQA